MTLTSKDITFTAGNHRYHVTDTTPKQFIPSVTTICGLLDKPFLVEWAAREAATAAALAVAGRDKLSEAIVGACIAEGRQAHRDQREHGSSVGTAVHQRIKMQLVPGWEPPDEEYVDGGIEADLAMDAFFEWWNEREAEGWQVAHCEFIVVHPSGSYVGTPDLLIYHPDEQTYRLVDFKTSNQSEDNPLALYPEYVLQVAGYWRAIIDSPEYAPDWIDSAEIVALGKQGQLATTPFTGLDLDVYADAFQLLAQLISTYRSIERVIRALNKVEKARRADAEGVVA